MGESSDFEKICLRLFEWKKIPGVRSPRVLKKKE